MAEERFEDKTLTKKDEAKIKGESINEIPNPHEHKTEPVTTPAETTKKSEKPKAEKQAKAEKHGHKTVLERRYTVNLTEAYAKPKYHRADRAISILRQFALRHMKGKTVKVDVALNNAIRTSAKPAKKVHVVLQKDDAGTINAALVPPA